MKKLVLAALAVFTLALAVPVNGARADQWSDQRGATDEHGHSYDRTTG